jgi:thymidine kinase
VRKHLERRALPSELVKLARECPPPFFKQPNPFPDMPLELYIGPMFAGKSTMILGIIRRNEVIGRSTLCITSSIDVRYRETGWIVSHNQDAYPAVPVSKLMPLVETEEFCTSTSIIVEEAQFFPDLKEFVLASVETHGKHVVCVGLDGDSERRPFGQLLDLIPYCDKVQKLTALCSQCRDGTEALFTFRKKSTKEVVAVGGAAEYEPLCRRHYLSSRASSETPNDC